MSRLTRTDISMAIDILSHPQWGDESDIRKAAADAIESMKELQHYKDLEEQGRLIEVIRCKDCALLQGCKNGQYLGLDGYCSHAEPLAELKGK